MTFILAVATGWGLRCTKAWQSVLHRPAWGARALLPAIIRCIVKIRAGFRYESDESMAHALLQECLQRGLPVYAEGLLLMQEAASSLRSTNHGGQSEGVFNAIERLAAANAWAGSALSFYGLTPDKPSPEKFVGTPDRGRPLKRRQASKRAIDRVAPVGDEGSVIEAALTAAPVGAGVGALAGAIAGVIVSEQQADYDHSTRAKRRARSGRSKQLADDVGVFYLESIGN